MLTNDQYDISVWSLHISQWSLSNPRVFLLALCPFQERIHHNVLPRATATQRSEAVVHGCHSPAWRRPPASSDVVED